MFAANSYSIHTATDADADALNALAARNGHAPLTGQVLIGQTNSGQTAAVSLDDGTLIADPGAAHVAATVRARAIGTWAHASAPQLRDRMLAGLPTWYRAVSTPVAEQTPDTDHQPATAVA
jgi:hypothetical protein